MKYIVDRITDGIVVLEHEDCSHSEHSLTEFDFDISQGSLVEYIDGKFSLSEDDSAARKKKLFLMQQRLVKKQRKFPH